MKSDICPVNILQLPLCTEKNILYFDQENDAYEVFHKGCSQTEGAGADEEPQWPLQDRGQMAAERLWMRGVKYKRRWRETK